MTTVVLEGASVATAALGQHLENKALLVEGRQDETKQVTQRTEHARGGYMRVKLRKPQIECMGGWVGETTSRSGTQQAPPPRSARGAKMK